MVPPFELTKWYLDCVSPAGDAVVAYCADLNWRTARLAYERILTFDDARQFSASLSLRRHARPRLSGQSIGWRSPALGFEGEWHQRVPPIKETLYRCDRGAVEWECLFPSAAAHVRVRRNAEDCGHDVTGDGYAEHIRITVPPWLLPISTLRWGRVATERLGIVWIEWQDDTGARPTCDRWVYANGVRVACRHLDDDGLVLEDGTRVWFGDRRVLRHGPLGTTALAGIPRLGNLAPARMLAADECKWVSSTTLTAPGQGAVHAWAIHEVVRWPRQ